MRKITSLIAFTVALIGSIAVQAQVYPVQGNGVLIPPYSVYLADYTEGTSDRIVLNVVLNDVSRPDLRVRLRAKIIGQSVTLETKPEYIGRELVLEGGIPLRLTGIDLAEYFDPVNLNFSGISRREFEKTGALPQGLYQFCFEVLEYNRGVKISNSICANGWLILNDPPLINLPRNGDKLVPTQPQNIVFQWTPRHTGSPNSAFTTEYDVKLVELWPANRNPNDAILTSPPILEETTRSTTFIYDVSQTPLELGRHYALQIKAKSIAGADELDLFKNNGKSEVVTFMYGDPCTVPQNILLEATSATRFTARWAGDFNHTGYSLRYRLADNPSAPWYTNTTLVPDAAISGLQPNTTYEVQIAGGCGVFESLYSGSARIKTFDTSEQGYSCGMPLEQFNLDPANLLDVLKVGDVIQAGDFDVKIAKVSGSNGTFTGEGVIEVPFFNKARVKAEFANIVVNKDMRMVNGYLNVTGAGVDIVPSGVLNMMDELIGAADSALTNLENNRPQPFDPYAFVPDTTLTLPGPVTVTDDNGTVVVTDANGVQHRLPPGTEAAIVDDQGNGTLIDSQGKAHSVSGTVATAAANREYNLALKFTEAKNNPTYGFDALDEPDAEVFKILANRYTKLEDNYYVPYKSVEAGHTATVTGELEGNDIDKSRIRFQLGGVTMPSTPFSGNESTVTVSGKADGEEEWLIAVLPAENETGKDQVLGRVNVVSYNKINKNVVIIPVNGNTFSESEGTALQTELNKIYHQAVVSWSVSVRSGIQVAGIDPFDVGATGMLTNYTPHMKDVINAYQDNMKDGEDTYYIFLVKNPKDPKIAGFMPRSKQAGFIFTDKTPGLQTMARTVAHELGHGVFNLHHTFMEENFGLPENETDNLMDYAGGTKLYKYQWDMIRNPPMVIGMFEDDEEAMAKRLFDSKYVYLHDDLSTTAWASTVKGDEFTPDIIGKVDSLLSILDNNGKKTYLYFNYVWFDANNVNKFEERMESQFKNAKAHIKKETGEDEFSLLLIVNAKYDAALSDGLKSVSFRERFLPVDGLNPECTKSVRDYLLSNSKRKFTDGLNNALAERAEKLMEKLKDCSVEVTTSSGEGEEVLKRSIPEGDLRERVEQSMKMAVDDAIEAVGNEDNAACNICTRAAFYYLTGDPVLFPKKGSCLDNFDACRVGGENYFKGVISGDGSASSIVSDFNNLITSDLKDYFDEEVKGESETFEQFWTRLQKMADEGGAIVGTYGDNHVFMLVAGGTIPVVNNTDHTEGGYLKSQYKSDPNIDEGDKYGFCFAARSIAFVPRIIECGVNIKSSNAPIYANMDYKGVTGSGGKKPVKWFRYKK